MTSKAKTPEEYIQQLPLDRQEAILKIKAAINSTLPKGFSEGMSYGMIAYVVPQNIYPEGYHCNPKLPLPFINLASQKNFIALYHSGIYADENLYNWFVSEYPKHCKRKLDMGKSCIRFKYLDDIPYQLIGELCSKVTTKQWITLYEKNIKKS